MSLRTLPILFFNLGGEMLYILDQRLRAQNILPDKASKVMRDIVGQMFDSRCVQELFRPSKVFTKKALRGVFAQLAHASIMKLNSTAMEKLYDLMVMAVKYQVLLCKRGEDVILVTLNHLDTVREFVAGSEEHVALVDSACKTLTDYYSQLTAAQCMQLRFTLLSIFQDTHKRVSIFLKTGAQLRDGRFVIPSGGPVPHGFEPPGIIRYYDDHGVCTVKQFSPLQKHEPAEPQGSFEVNGNRGISLGRNIYATERLPDSSASSLDRRRGVATHIKEEEEEEEEERREEEEEDVNIDSTVKAELVLLERLLVGMRQQHKSADTFKLRLTDEEETQGRKSAVKVIEINPSKKGSAELNKIKEDFSTQDFDKGTEDDDLLDLMDKAF